MSSNKLELKEYSTLARAVRRARGLGYRAVGVVVMALLVAAPSAGAFDEKPSEKKDEARVGAGADGFVIQSESGDYRLQLRAYFNFDGRFYPASTALSPWTRSSFAGLGPSSRAPWRSTSTS
jgi:hypothetical protein